MFPNVHLMILPDIPFMKNKKIDRFIVKMTLDMLVSLQQRVIFRKVLVPSC